MRQRLGELLSLFRLSSIEIELAKGNSELVEVLGSNIRSTQPAEIVELTFSYGLDPNEPWVLAERLGLWPLAVSSLFARGMRYCDVLIIIGS